MQFKSKFDGAYVNQGECCLSPLRLLRSQIDEKSKMAAIAQK